MCTYIYIYINTVEATVPIEPSDALGSTPLTIRNIAMGNLLSMAKSISRRIRRDAGRRRHHRRRRTNERTNEQLVWPATVLRIAPIYYECDDLAPVVGVFPLLISRPETKKGRRRR